MTDENKTADNKEEGTQKVDIFFSQDHNIIIFI